MGKRVCYGQRPPQLPCSGWHCAALHRLGCKNSRGRGSEGNTHPETALCRSAPDGRTAQRSISADTDGAPLSSQTVHAWGLTYSVHIVIGIQRGGWHLHQAASLIVTCKCSIETCAQIYLEWQRRPVLPPPHNTSKHAPHASLHGPCLHRFPLTNNNQGRVGASKRPHTKPLPYGATAVPDTYSRYSSGNWSWWAWINNNWLQRVRPRRPLSYKTVDQLYKLTSCA